MIEKQPITVCKLAFDICITHLIADLVTKLSFSCSILFVNVSKTETEDIVKSSGIAAEDILTCLAAVVASNLVTFSDNFLAPTLLIASDRESGPLRHISA